MVKIPVYAFDIKCRSFRPALMVQEDSRFCGIEYCSGVDSDIYYAPGFIDSHAHIYPGATDLGITADKIGLKTGVHLVVDAGSSGSVNFPCYRDYVAPTYSVQTRAFLNISKIGLVTKQPYYDRRNIDVQKAVDCFANDSSGLLLGLKVLSSGIVVEDAQLSPMYAALETADKIGCPMLVHMVEGPPTNEDNMALLRRGDIITHIFHGAPNLKANRKASGGREVDTRFCNIDNIMWEKDGMPTKPLADAISRGVYLDVGHGAASLDQNVARTAIHAGVRNFSISTDAHIRNIDTVVFSLAHTMSKFLALGMSLDDVVSSVTVIPAKQLRLGDWCDHMDKRATLFRLRSRKTDDPPFLDAYHTIIEADKIIEPVAVNIGGEINDIIHGWSKNIVKSHI